MTNRRMGWLGEPLLWFLVIGVGLIGAQSLFHGTPEPATSKRIRVGASEVDVLCRNWAARWKRPPSEAELRALVKDYVRQEILYREALAMGLDRDDEVIRRRMVQKLEFLTEDLAAQTEPTDAELGKWFAEHLDDYRYPERRRFSHVYFSVERRGDSTAAAATTTLGVLRHSRDAPDLSTLGDSFLLDHGDKPLSREEVTGLFGAPFATTLFEVEPGTWQGPIESSYGLHLVLVSEVRAGRVPELSEIREEVLRDFRAALEKRTSDALFENLRAGYEVEIDEQSILGRTPGSDDRGGDR
jgi:hypothetical protein